MPYTGPTARACYAQASACKKAGFNPGWACNDDWYQKYKIGRQNTVVSGGYTTRCGPPLPKNLAPLLPTTKKRYTK